MPAETVPAGYHTVTPFLVVNDAPGLIVFLERVFRGEVTERWSIPTAPSGTPRCASAIPKSCWAEPPSSTPPSPARFTSTWPDADAVYRRALEAGAQSIMEPADQLYGDRNAGVKDAVATRGGLPRGLREVSPEEIARRMGAVYRRSSPLHPIAERVYLISRCVEGPHYPTESASRLSPSGSPPCCSSRLI